MSTKDLGPALPLPRSGDILVRADLPDWINNACLNYLQQGEQSPFVQGYRRGAQQLVQHVVETQSDQDFLVYPIIFLYRHHMELGLKRIIGRAAHLIERSLTAIEKKHLNAHRLDALWKDLKPMLGEICQAAGWSRLDHCDIEGIDSYIRQLAELDPHSFSFRYAASKEGVPLLSANLKHINLRHFAEMMERLASYMDGIDSATSALEESRAEWKSEMASFTDRAHEYS